MKVGKVKIKKVKLSTGTGTGTGTVQVEKKNLFTEQVYKNIKQIIVFYK